MTEVVSATGKLKTAIEVKTKGRGCAVNGIVTSDATETQGSITIGNVTTSVLYTGTREGANKSLM